MRVRHLLNSFSLSLFIGALALSGPARTDILDIAIEVVKPELAPAKPLLKCMIGGTAAATCIKQAAVQQGKEQIDQTKQDIQNDPDFKEVIEVYQYASSQQWAKLVAKVGVTAACAAFAIPGSNILCDEFSGELVNATAFVADQGATVVNDVGKTVGKLIESGVATFSCALGFDCPQEQDPTTYLVVLDQGGGQYSIKKWDLAEVWKIDYVARIGEGIKARISDHRHLERMIASDPPTRYANVVYSYDDDALGSHSVHEREHQMFLEGAGDVNQTGLFPRAFMPYGKEMNAQWIVLVNKATAESLADTANTFTQSSDNYMNTVRPEFAAMYFDAAFTKMKGWGRNIVNKCRLEVENPARALPMWAAGAKQAHDDGSYGPATLIANEGAAKWLKVTDWCKTIFLPALTKDVGKRKEFYSNALKMGCEYKENHERGLNCAAEVSSGKFSLISGGLKQCYNAYSPLGKKYCKAIVPREMAPAEPDSEPAMIEAKPNLSEQADQPETQILAPIKPIHKRPALIKRTAPRALEPTEPDPEILEAQPDQPDTQILAPMEPIQKRPALIKRIAPRALEPIEPDPAILEAQPDQSETQILVPMEPVEERPAPAIAKSTLCRFTSGPRADETQDYAPMAPIPVGSNCQDARGSFGIVVAE